MDFHCDCEMEKLYFHFNLFRPNHYDALEGLSKIYTLPFPIQSYDMIYRHGTTGNFADAMVVKALLYDLLSQFQQAYNLISEEIPVYSRNIRIAITYIQENLSATLRLEDIAKLCFVSRSTLTELFRKEVGTSLGKYIDDQLISAAQRQLSQTTQSIGQISNALGYSSQCYFSRRFKQMCGMTPQVYRARNKI
jgi:AraC-like DNA-binding protein